MNQAKIWMRAVTAGICLWMTGSAAQAATTYYVRKDGGTATQCTGTSNAPYAGSGNRQACAFNHPNWALAPQGNNPSKLAGGDTLIIDGANGGQYMMGYGSPNSAGGCSRYAPWDCYLRKVPSGLDPSRPTRILGRGYDTGCAAPPQLWGTERLPYVINLHGSNNVELQCLDITDHSDCQEFGPKACNRGSFPYGPWASKGIEASNSSNVLIKNVSIHGLAHTGIKAGRLKDWTLLGTKIVANSFVGWDGDIGANQSSNAGTLLFDRVKIQYNGCGETYPGRQPYNCFSQSQGGYGDGIGTHSTGGNWVFSNSDISHNTSDGIDLLYHTGKGSVTVSRTRTEGNAGNQIKSSAGTNTIENSVVIGNCGYFQGNSRTWNSGGFDHCRAQGNAIAINFRYGQSAVVRNSTVVGNGDGLVITMGAACNGTETMRSVNNIFLAGRRFISDQKPSLYFATGATGNGDGSCGKIKFADDYSIIHGTRKGAADCQGKAHSKCADPKLAETSGAWYTGGQYNVNLRPDSPARGGGLKMSGVSGLDYNGFDRGGSWDIGAIEYGSVPASVPAASIIPTPTMPVTAPVVPKPEAKPAPKPVPVNTPSPTPKPTPPAAAGESEAPDTEPITKKNYHFLRH